MKSIVSIIPFDHVSPSLAETIRRCPLQAGLSRCKETAPFTLGHPQAWLGAAYHGVLAGLCTLSPSGASSENELKALWKQAIERQYSRVVRHPLDKRYGTPERWPGYNLTLASAGVAAARLHGVLATQGHTFLHLARLPEHGMVVEKRLSALNGQLVGRPDLYNSDVVIDFKTGAAIEQVSGETQTTRVKPSYVRQLRIYAFLVWSSLRQWPKKAAIWPMNGAPVEVEISPDECAHEAEAAVSMLTQYNADVRGARSPVSVASPSPSTCCGCPFQILCPAFWKTVAVDWLADLGSHVIEAHVSETPKNLYGGSAVLVPLTVERGTVEHRSCQIGPVRQDIHEVAAHLQQGDILRIVGLPPGTKTTMVPSIRSVVMRREDLPEIRVLATEPCDVQ